MHTPPPKKNASKYSPKIFFEYPKDFRGLIRPLKFFLGGIINVWSSSLRSRRNLHIGFIMGCRGDFFRKMKKTVWGGQFDPPLVKEGLNQRLRPLGHATLS